jgi:hypothetical protein
MDRELLWEGLRETQHQGIDPMDRVSRVEARAYQESHLRQVRALLIDIEEFRSCRLTKSQRKDWSLILRTWVMWRLSSRPNVHSATTVIGWIHAVRGRLPTPPTVSVMASLLRGLAATRLLRPNERTRAIAPEVMVALRAQRTAAETNTEARLVWVIMTLMSGGAVRLADAVRMAMPGGLEDWCEIGCEVALFPTIEKTDMTGSREVEPIVLVIPDPVERAWMCALISSPTIMTEASASHIERRAADVWHSHGIDDVRAIRRTIGERAGSRKDAALILRHAADSPVTLRYSGTRDRIPRLRDIAKRVAFTTD